MGNESEIPVLDFSRSNGVILIEESEGRKEMSKKVREAFENHGCLLVRCDEISNPLREDLFTGLKALFDLPEETKQKFFSPNAYRGYTNKGDEVPHADSFGIYDAHKPNTLDQDFVDLLWPEGNQTFSKALNSMTSKVRELSLLILNMIVEGFGLPQQYNMDVEQLNSYSNTRLTKYKLPEDNKDSEIALAPHCDKATLSLICENGVQGLQVLSKTGNWVDVNIPRNGFAVLVGDMLKAWTNGIFQAAKHRVVTRGDKERITFILMAVPKESMVIKAPSELVDDEKHPLCYKSFMYEEYIYYRYSTNEEGSLDKFAGL
ncbi:hypothetical protein P8452_48793 [Trifolium repens]|nr:hypothetical protein P8452_48793 [Trifolium repens]